MEQNGRKIVDLAQRIGAVPDALRTDLVRIEELRSADSPRLSGLNMEHSRMLAEIDATLPPILVSRRTMRVIDGMHRLHAAMLRGEEYIEVEFFDGSEREEFVAAVRANTAHGLPLSLAERQAAAARIICSHPEWSDRAVGKATGLAPGTVASVRHRAGAATVSARVGRDGRTRPVSSASGRVLASEIIAARPEASLREIAREAGISLATARDVRARVRRGDDPVPPRERRNNHLIDATRRPQPVPAREPSREPTNMHPQSAPESSRAAILQGLMNDPSLRFTESGRNILRWLNLRAGGTEGWEEVAADVPPHSIYVLADLGRQCAAEWSGLADQLEQRVRRMA
ncbi:MULTISPECIES: ParB/RepB/Spo0J family partition protein [unclassified Plantactinospora]|uniref:ParB/RepB/Spo0J family partition protein n=1 Tax=unclassified Plantactinospora TaxID=2631981 RepID=UPI0018FE5D99|nr:MULTISPECIES: ParB/RepB/Spo0J family partition protein [unclassified Plantactinospora]